MTTAESTFRRRVLAGVAVATVVLLLYLARGALFPFIITGVLAYLLFPAVKALESLMPWRKRWPGTSRIIAVMGIYALALAVLAGALALVIPPAYRESREFIESLPDYYADARRTIEGWNEAYTTRIPEEVRAQIESSLAELGSILVGVASAVLARTISTVSNTLTVVLGLAMVPVLLFYLLKDQELALSTLYSFLPEDARPHARKVVAIVNRVLGAYIRAQLVLMLFVGVLVFVGLWLLGIRFAVLLAVIAGVFELVPVVGPLLGAIPGVLVTLATSPGEIAWVVLIYVAVQLVENSLLVPRIQGEAVNLHPAVIMVILVVASETFGIFGVIAAVPVAGIARDVFMYFYRGWSGETVTLEEAAASATIEAPSPPAGETSSP